MATVNHATLAEAFVAAQAEMPAVEKDSTNPHFKSRFTSLDHLIAKTRPVLNRHGLSITQWPCMLAVNGEVAHALKTTLRHMSGEVEESTMPLIVAKNDMQGLGSALTYAKRYAWAAALGISTDEDDDGNAASPPPAEPAKPAVKRPTREATKRMMALFTQAGMTDRQDRLTYTQGVIRRGIVTSTDMTAAEVKAVSDALAKKDPGPPAVPPGPEQAGPGQTVEPPAEEAGPAESYAEKRKHEAATTAQLERLDELVTDAIENRIATIHDLWVQTAAYRKTQLADLINELGGADPGRPGLLWAPLRASLTRVEAGDLTGHLQQLRRDAGLPESDIPF